MRKFLLILIVLMLFSFVGCTQKATGDEKTAEEFVKAQGYFITARKGTVDKYILEKSKLYGGPGTIPYQQIWSVQTEEPDQYFGKKIVTVGFTVKNHPLQKRDSTAKNGVNVYIMLTDGKVIGGYSYPDADVAGGFTSLDGKTMEEMTGLSYQQWYENWKKKYGDYTQLKSSFNP